MSDEEENGPEFVYGPKDGAKVPPILWVLDVIDLQEHRPTGTIVHRYNLNYDTKNYVYVGWQKETSNG